MPPAPARKYTRDEIAAALAGMDALDASSRAFERDALRAAVEDIECGWQDEHAIRVTGRRHARRAVLVPGEMRYHATLWDARRGVVRYDSTAALEQDHGPLPVAPPEGEA